MSNHRTIVVATRKSALALAQSRAWMASLRERCGVDTDELHVTTTGDRIQDRPLSQVGGKGLFIKEIEEALLAGRADVAVHSLKDIPADLAPGLHVACIPAREDPRDAVKTRSGLPLSELPAGARVGTSSLRRIVQLRLLRPDLDYVPLRGNIDTRLRRCDEGAVDAVVLALAGLRRLGLADQVTEVLSAETCLPAVGQGALAIEIRGADDSLRELMAVLEDTETAVSTAAERGVLRAVEGNCQMPIAAYAERHGEQLRLRGLLAQPDGTQLRRREYSGPWPQTLQQAEVVGAELGRRLLTAS